MNGEEDGVTLKGVGERQQRPTKNDDAPAIQDLVIADIERRKAVGLERYGTLLKPFNGRDALLDAYQEALDLCQYLRQEIEERNTARTLAERAHREQHEALRSSRVHSPLVDHSEGKP